MVLDTMSQADLNQLPILEEQEAPPEESLYSLELNPGLTSAEREEAESIVRWLQGNGQFYGIAGLMLVTGMPRQGKGLFSNVLSYKVKRYFKGKHVLRDDHPTSTYGPYTLFNEDVLMEDIARMKEIATGDVPKEAKSAKQKAEMIKDVKEWQSSRGEVMFKNAVAVLDEGWRYMNNRRPMSPMNLTLSGIIKMWGHLDCMLMILAQRQHDLDRFTCLPYVTHEARCVYCKDRPNTVQVMFYRVQYSSARQALVPVDKPTRIFVDGGKMRPELGGKRYFDLYRSKAAPLFDYGLSRQKKGEM
jgi:hypothetical protein